MKIFFPDGTETVTGSKWSLESGDSQILLDCGLFQDYKWLCERSRQPLLPDIPSKLLAICLPGEGIVHWPTLFSVAIFSCYRAGGDVSGGISNGYSEMLHSSNQE